MKKTIVYQDAMVEITKVNIQPKWGLYNGAIGKVVDIIFRDGGGVLMRDGTPTIGSGCRPHKVQGTSMGRGQSYICTNFAYSEAM
jgi:hypothetical protein